MAMLVLGIDIGTYSSKAVLVTPDGTVRAEAQRPHGLEVPEAGYAEHDGETVWWADLVGLCRDILQSAESHHGITREQVRAVAVSAIGPCVLPVDVHGSPLRPAILYGVDTRAREQITCLNDRLGSTWIQKKSGTSLSSQSAGPKILWVRENEPDLARRTWKYMTSTTYLVFKLTGAVVMDHYTAAFYDPLYNIHEQEWMDPIPADICRLDQLPDLLWSAQVAGHVTPAAAAKTGLPPGIPVTTGTADAASEAVSAGVIAPGSTMLMYGSSMFLITVNKELKTPGVFWAAPFLFPETFALAAGMSTTGSLTQWFREHLAAEERHAEEAGGTAAYQALAAAAGQISPGCNGVLALPYFSGERTPINDADARGMFAGISLKTTRGHLYRALLEGVGYGIRHNLEAMGSALDNSSVLTAVGGGTRNSLWLQIVSDILGKPQQVRHTIGAAFGDAALAAVAAGILANQEEIMHWIDPAVTITPDPAVKMVYDRFYGLFRELYEQTAPIVHQLVELTRDSDKGSS